MQLFFLALLLQRRHARPIARPHYRNGRGSVRSGCPRCHGTARDVRAHGRRIPDGQRRAIRVQGRKPPVRCAWLSPPRASRRSSHRCRPTRRDLQVTLQPAPFFEAVNVTSSRTDVPRADPSVTVTVLPAVELLTSAALTLDDALKMVPGFTLFRRTSSRVSNPTAQGVTLRGLGGTGASRSLVLADGVPLNDAFGGWVYWDKVPQVAIDRVEVLRGSGSDLYGADAVGGVVQILTWHPSRLAARALVEGGGLQTGRVSMFGGGRSRRLELHGRGRVVHHGRLHSRGAGTGSRNRPARSDRFQDWLEASIRYGIDWLPVREWLALQCQLAMCLPTIA